LLYRGTGHGDWLMIKEPAGWPEGSNIYTAHFIFIEQDRPARALPRARAPMSYRASKTKFIIRLTYGRPHW